MKNSNLNSKFSIGLIFVITILGVIIFQNYEQQNMIPNDNIFSEIYNKTNSTYLEYNIFRKLDDVSVSNKEIYDKNMNETGKLTPEVVYKSRVLPDGYSDVSISFNLHDREKGLTIWFYKNIVGSRYLWFLTRYNVENNRLEKKSLCVNLRGKLLRIQIQRLRIISLNITLVLVI